MRIAVVHHTNNATDYSMYLSEILDEAASRYGYDLKVWSDTVPAAVQKVPDTSLVHINTNATSKLALAHFYRLQLASSLKKIKPEIIVHLQGIGINTSIKQLLAFDTHNLHQTKTFSPIDDYAFKHLQTSLPKAATCIGFSDVLNEQLKTHGKVNTVKIPFTSAQVFRRFEWHEKIMIKAQQADNREYFLTVCDDENEEGFVELLKAFTRFKNWQQSSMFLLVLPKYEKFTPAIHYRLNTYKFKEQVRIIEDLPEKDMVAIVASAYAFVHVPLPEPDMLAITAAVQSSIPVISYQNQHIAEYAGDAALLCEAGFESLGNTMINIYKNEDLRTALAEAANTISERYTRQDAIATLWNLITA